MAITNTKLEHFDQEWLERSIAQDPERKEIYETVFKRFDDLMVFLKAAFPPELGDKEAIDRITLLQDQALIEATRQVRLHK